MLGTVEECVRSCPECGVEIRTDHRFVAWCAACDWNVDPGEPEEPGGRLDTLPRRLAGEHGERLLAEVTTDELLRPRFPRLPEDEQVLYRADAPELYALIDEVAGVVGTTGVDAVAVNGEANASVSTYGLRRRRLLTIGLAR